jgi:uncharacterized protein (UPF0335 family)
MHSKERHMGRPKGSKNHTADGAALRNSPAFGVDLRSYIERIEAVNAEIADLTSDRKEIYAEIKAAGYDAPTIRAIVKRRAADPEERHAKEMLLDMYLAALGDFASTPLGEAGADRLREAV